MSEQKRPAIYFIGIVVGSSAALLAFVNALDIRSAQRQQVKMQAALDFVHRWNDPQFFHTRKNAGPALLQFKELPEERKKTFVRENREIANDIVDMLNVLEALSIAIQKDLVDEEFARLFFRGIVVGFWQNGQGFIETRRAERGNPRLFTELQKLFVQWSSL